MSKRRSLDVVVTPKLQDIPEQTLSQKEGKKNVQCIMKTKSNDVKVTIGTVPCNNAKVSSSLNIRSKNRYDYTQFSHKDDYKSMDSNVNAGLSCQNKSPGKSVMPTALSIIEAMSVARGGDDIKGGINSRSTHSSDLDHKTEIIEQPRRFSFDDRTESVRVCPPFDFLTYKNTPSYFEVTIKASGAFDGWLGVAKQEQFHRQKSLFTEFFLNQYHNHRDDENLASSTAASIASSIVDVGEDDDDDDENHPFVMKSRRVEVENWPFLDGEENDKGNIATSIETEYQEMHHLTILTSYQTEPNRLLQYRR